jgi:hypothetical protein
MSLSLCHCLFSSACWCVIRANNSFDERIRKLKRLTKRGYQSAIDLYMKISPQFNEPLITRPISLVVCEVFPAGDAGGAAYTIGACAVIVNQSPSS